MAAAAAAAAIAIAIAIAVCYTSFMEFVAQSNIVLWLTIALPHISRYAAYKKSALCWIRQFLQEADTQM